MILPSIGAVDDDAHDAQRWDQQNRVCYPERDHPTHGEPRRSPVQVTIDITRMPVEAAGDEACSLLDPHRAGMS
jgi:hypothetical protein